MINKILKLKGVGIFDDFNADSSLLEFKKFNLFYGWNGSGKTTLSRFLNAINGRDFSSKFENGEYELLVDSNKRTHKTTSVFPHRLYVFNQEFISDNIDWTNNGAKSIVVISEGKIEERKRYFELKDKEIPIQIQKSAIASNKVGATNKEIEGFLTDEAKAIKQSFQLIDTGDSYFVNYDKRKLRSFIEKNRAAILSEEAILNPADLDLLHKRVKPIEKSVIDDSYSEINLTKLDEAKSKIESLLRTSLVDTSVKRLNENNDINEWVKSGVELHKRHNSAVCEYCRQEISLGRRRELNNHFSDVYLETVNKINNAIGWLSSLVPEFTFPDKGLLFEELAQTYVANLTKIKSMYTELLSGVESWKLILEEKGKNPFIQNLSITSDLKAEIGAFNEAIMQLKLVLKQHNFKVEGFDEQLKQAKTQLELHYVADSIKQKDYFTLIKRFEDEKDSETTENNKLSELQKEQYQLEAILSDTVIAADDFNEKLHRFLGRNDITLNYDSALKGFKIYRGGDKKQAKNLSEGEKTAIAFTYFIAKLKENGNEIKRSILVIDDPISSFDSNHLYHSFACLRDICENAKQSFILTHSFQYFKLVRDWLSRKNNGKEENDCNARFYSIESSIRGLRTSSLKNCHDSLLKYGSEYHFLYLKLKEYRVQSTLDLAEASLVANISRKVLETFLSFKFPKGRNNFKDLLEAGYENRIITEKVYRFINKYSHVDGYDLDTSNIDNLLGEGNNIVDQVFKIIEDKDACHYGEMESLIVV